MNADIQTAVDLALEAGFSVAAPLDCSTIVLRPEVREACEKNTCGRYGKNWSCPPGCGTLEQCAARIARFSAGIIFETVGKLEDEFDGDGMMQAAASHADSLKRLLPGLRELFPDMLPVNTGSCNNCDTCTYPDAPCRDPAGAMAPMEALGMVVSEVCASNGVPYYHGKGTITYVGCCLIK